MHELVNMNAFAGLGPKSNRRNCKPTHSGDMVVLGIQSICQNCFFDQTRYHIEEPLLVVLERRETEQLNLSGDVL